MQIDSRLGEIDDSLYRVAVRALVVEDSRVLLVKEHDGDGWWAIPGGGIDYGETLKDALIREIREELGVSPEFVRSDFQTIHYNIGKIVNGIPRMNIYFKVIIPSRHIKKSGFIEQYQWFSEQEFMELNLNPSYDKTELARMIFR